MSWDDSVTTRLQTMALRPNQARSQDDHNVEYYGRPHQNQMSAGSFGPRRWGPHAGMDDSVLADNRGMALPDLENRMHSLELNGARENQNASKKLWSVDDSNKPENRTYATWAPRDDSGWGAAPTGMSQASNLGLNMAEFVLETLPTSRNSAVDRNRITGAFGPSQESEEKKKTPSPFEEGDRLEEKDMAPNGMLPNGLEDASAFRSSHQTSPNTADVNAGLRPENDFLENQPMGQANFTLDPSQISQMAIDPSSFDYNNHVIPSENYNFNEYSQMLQRQQQLLSQQFALAQHQQQLGLPPLPGSYVISAQEPYPVTGIPIAGPTMIHPGQYSYLQTPASPWGMYAPGLVQQSGQQQQQHNPAQQQQQQPSMMRGQGGRPLTPSQQGESMGGANPSQLNTQNLQAQNPGYQLMTPAYMMDPNGQLVLGGARNMGVRLVSPHTSLLVPAATPNQQGGANGMNQNALRLMASQSQQVGTTPSGLSNSTNSSANNNNFGYSSSNSLAFTTASHSGFPPITNNLAMQNGYGNSNMGQMNSNAPGTIGQRRESYDVKRQMSFMGNYYNGAVSSMAPSPAGHGSLLHAGQSMTPPPTLSGSSSTLSINACGTGRPYSAAPGAEAKYRGNLMSPNGLYANNMFTSRVQPPRSTSMFKEVTGRSRLLEDFRNNRIPNLLLKDLHHHVVEFSQDQHGSRFIQQKLERATPQEKSMVFTEILNNAYHLMTDVFGNYVIQKFFEFGTPDQKAMLAQRVRGNVYNLALQMYGCRVIQKALESIPADMQVEVVKELEGQVLKCVKDQNGNHVVQKCIECVDPQYLQFILDSFQGQVYVLSTHPYGCRVIQRILEHCTIEQTKSVLAELHEQTERLIQDQYGNYVIQHILQHGNPEDKSKIVACIHGKVMVYSTHKFASNVVEKCVINSSRQEKSLLIEEVISQSDGHHGGVLCSMMKDQFANYVVQKMLDTADPPQRKLLMSKIRPHMTAMRKYTYGKHILGKLEKYFLRNNDMPGMGMTPNGALQ